MGAYGVVEEQARGTPHCHAAIWGGLSPQLVQIASAAEELIDAVAESYDYMVRARLEPKTTANPHRNLDQNLGFFPYLFHDKNQ